MKARHVFWPVIVLGAVSLASACSGDGGSTGSDAAGGSSNAGGADGNSTGDTGSGATNSKGATDSGGGMGNTGDSGSSTGAMSTGGGDEAGGAGGNGPLVDLCEGKDITCEDDGNECTEDECNPATGECGIPRDETECDDGLYCNGVDSCVAGECTGHEGSPCTGTCNEGGDYCECATKDDCPADEVGDWDGECVYANECVLSGSRSRIVTSYTCNEVGKCVGSPKVENDTCPRQTNGLSCTDDGLRCNGAEVCKNGSCVPNDADPCKGNASMPYCWPSGDPVCRKCTTTSKSGSPNMGCADMQYCCGGVCQADSCLQIITKLTTSLTGTKITAFQ